MQCALYCSPSHFRDTFSLSLKIVQEHANESQQLLLQATVRCGHKRLHSVLLAGNAELLCPRARDLASTSNTPTHITTTVRNTAPVPHIPLTYLIVLVIRDVVHFIRASACAAAADSDFEGQFEVEVKQIPLLAPHDADTCITREVLRCFQSRLHPVFHIRRSSKHLGPLVFGPLGHHTLFERARCIPRRSIMSRIRRSLDPQSHPNERQSIHNDLRPQHTSTRTAAGCTSIFCGAMSPIRFFSSVDNSRWKYGRPFL